MFRSTDTGSGSGRHRIRFAAAAVAGLLMANVAQACPEHIALWAESAAQQSLLDSLASSGSTPSTTAAAARFVSADATSNLAPVTAWKQNFTGLRGSSTDATINGYVSGSLADVQTVRFDATYAYVNITDIPSHTVGPFPGNPAYPAVQNRTLRIPRVPAIASTKTTTGNGPIGVMVNGVYLFNAADARTYNNAGIWQQNANVVEVGSFDAGRGHPAPGMGGGGGTGLQAGTYHYHQAPQLLIEQLDPNNTGQHHSPLIGYAFDGFPIYGPYGYVDASGATGGVRRMTSGYKIRDDVLAGTRNTLIDGGTVLPTAQRGPAVNTTYPAGYYLQDFEWVDGLGDLNQYNMRWTVTPEYPEGTWAYFVPASATSSETVAFPYIVGPQYFGVVDTANLGMGNVTVPTTGVIQLRAGDSDASGSVNFDDLLALARNYGRTGQTNWSHGDFDRDGSVDFDDLLLLAKNYSSAAAAADDATAMQLMSADWALAQALVPEPGTAIGVSGMALAGLVRRWRRVGV